MVVMVIWEHGWVRVTAHTSHTVRGTQESIAKLRDAPTRWSGHPGHPIQPATQYSRLCSNTAQKRAVLGNTAKSLCHAPTVMQYSNTAQYSAIQLYSYTAIHHNTVYNALHSPSGKTQKTTTTTFFVHLFFGSLRLLQPNTTRTPPPLH